MLPLCQRSPSSENGAYRPISVTPFLSNIFEKIVAKKLSHFLESSSLLPPQFSYRRGLGTCDNFSHYLTVYRLF